MNEVLIEQAVKIAKKLLRPIESLELHAYPDPLSPMSLALDRQGKLALYKAGKFTLTKELLALSPEPVSIGYGFTGGIKLGDVWTLEQAEKALEDQVRVRVEAVLKAAPNLAKHSAEKLAACVSLQYNIGENGFKSSSVAKCVAAEDMQGAADAFPLWNKGRVNGQLVVVQGLVNRRKTERDLFLSVRG